MSAPPDRAPVTVVTGAAGGIGRSLCAGLLEAGHDLLAVVRRAVSISDLPLAPAGQRRVVVVADLATDAGRAAVREAAQREFGYITGLVNNAGVGMGSIRADYYKRPVQLAEIDSDTMARFLSVNAHAPIALTLELLPLFTAHWGRILNVGTSLTAMLRPGFLPYAMSKAALESASAVMARDLDGSNIAVCVLNPGGPVATPMAQREEEDHRAKLISPQVMVAPVCWALSRESGAINGHRVNATRWIASDPSASLTPIAWPQLATDSSWVVR